MSFSPPFERLSRAIRLGVLISTHANRTIHGSTGEEMCDVRTDMVPFVNRERLLIHTTPPIDPSCEVPHVHVFPPLHKS